MKYDFLFVGAGLYSCTFANIAKSKGKKCLIIEKRNHPFGNCYTENINGIDIHKYGPHIFHTSNEKIWNYVNQFCTFNNYINRPKVNYNNKIYSFPINLFTIYQLWGINNPVEAKTKLEKERIPIENPQNLEEWILSQVGEEIYYTFIYGYTKKQWNTEPKNLPSFIIKRLPIRLTFDDNYFNDIYQGIPRDGYSQMMLNMIDGIEIVLETDYLLNKDYWNNLAKHIIYTGCIDSYFNYIYGNLDYRSLEFITEKINIEDYQGNAIINYTSENIPYTRIIEHKHFNNKLINHHTIITKEFPANFTKNSEPYYPINNKHNTDLYNRYQSLTKNLNNITFGGRLGSYKYYDMHQIIGAAMKQAGDIIYA
jgi:UDP-galactopyranose mutase